MTELEDTLRQRLAGIRAFFLDMDGTLYVGDTAVDGAVAFIAALRARAHPYLVFTNNSSKSATDYRERLGRLGMPIDEQMALTISCSRQVGEQASEWVSKRVSG